MTLTQDLSLFVPPEVKSLFTDDDFIPIPRALITGPVEYVDLYTDKVVVETSKRVPHQVRDGSEELTTPLYPIDFLYLCEELRGEKQVDIKCFRFGQRSSLPLQIINFRPTI